jgi:hypothetical protein
MAPRPNSPAKQGDRCKLFPRVHIFVINLDRREDRWLEVSQQLRDLGLPFSRVSAVDGLQLDRERLSPVPRAVDACWLSHQKVFKMAVGNRAIANSLILEDDVVLNRSLDWAKLLADSDAFLDRSAIDVLQLGFLGPRSLGAWIEGRAFTTLTKLFRFLEAGPAAHDDRWTCLNDTPGCLGKVVPDSFLGGTHCYIVSKRAATGFLGLNIPTFAAPDDFFALVAEHQSMYRTFRIARVKRSLADQKSRLRGGIVDSDLERADYV